ncbi:MAG: hypothetical protein Q9159_002934 [Coniocarpon cinnabarinum]
MEAAVAFSLAASVLSVTDFALKVITLCHNIYKDGCDRPELVEYVAKFQTASTSLRYSLERPDIATVSDRNEMALYELSDKCIRSAHALDEELQKLRVCDRKGKILNFFYVTLRTAFKAERIERLRREMQDYQRALDTNLLIDIRERQRSLSMAWTAEFAELIETIKAKQFEPPNSGAALEDLLLRTQSHCQETIAEQFADLRVKLNSTEDHRKVLNSLYFPEMSSRDEEIAPAYQNTYEWIFQQPDEGACRWSDFRQWLLQGTDAYWISGKAGSGKSTLMHFINQQLTYNDICIFVEGELTSAHEEYDDLDLLKQSDIKNLSQLIVRKADGVFLWVTLALNAAVQGIIEADDVDQIMSRVQVLPSRLYDLYVVLLERIDPAHKVCAARCLWFACHVEWEVTLLTLGFMNFENTDTGIKNQLSNHQVIQMCKKVERQTRARCGGLLEVTSRRSNAYDELLAGAAAGSIYDTQDCQRLQELDSSSRSMRFLHRTAKDFLNETEYGQQFLALAGPWNVNAATARALIARLHLHYRHEGCDHCVLIKLVLDFTWHTWGNDWTRDHQLHRITKDAPRIISSLLDAGADFDRYDVLSPPDVCDNVAAPHMHVSTQLKTNQASAWSMVQWLLSNISGSSLIRTEVEEAWLQYTRVLWRSEKGNPNRLHAFSMQHSWKYRRWPLHQAMLANQPEIVWEKSAFSLSALSFLKTFYSASDNVETLKEMELILLRRGAFQHSILESIEFQEKGGTGRRLLELKVPVEERNLQTYVRVFVWDVPRGNLTDEEERNLRTLLEQVESLVLASLQDRPLGETDTSS